MPDCLGKKANDERCTRPVKGLGFCWQHDPDRGNAPGWDIDENGECTQAEFARFLKVDDSRVYQWRKEGVLSLTDNKRIDFLRAVRKLQAHGDPSHPRRREVLGRESGGAKPKDSTDPGEPLSTLFLKAKISEKEERAKIAQLDRMEREGELIERAKVERTAFELARTTRQQILAIPDRVAAELAGLTDAADIHTVLRRELRQALDELADFLAFGPAEQAAAE